MPKYQIIKEIKVIDTVILNKGEEIELLNENVLIMNTCFGQLELPFNPYPGIYQGDIEPTVSFDNKFRFLTFQPK